MGGGKTPQRSASAPVLPRLPSQKNNKDLPDYNLAVDLLGGNGLWRQKRAQEEWARQTALREEQERERKLREERLRQRRAEEERRRKIAEEKERQRLLEEQRRERLLQEERERKRREEMERERLRKLEEERQWRLRQPRTCPACNGSGRCPSCLGEGFLYVVYLAPKVQSGEEMRETGTSASQYGKRPRGCEACDGAGDGASWGAFEKGTGRCATCSGRGKVKAPEGGWLTDDDKATYPEPPAAIE